MFSFNNIVANILLEAGPATGTAETTGQTQGQPDPSAAQTTSNPKWLQDIINHHKKLGFSDIDSQMLDKILEVAFRQIQQRIADKQVEGVYDGVRILDAIERFKKLASPDKIIKGADLGRELLNNLDKQEFGNKIAADILKYQNGQQWIPKDPMVSEAWGKMLEGHDKLAAVALGTFNNTSVLETVKQIVKRRTNIFERISHLKSLSQPFTNLITDIFKTPEAYSSGQKKVTSDFSNIVDSVYITDLIQVALAAKEFFAAEIASKKTQPVETTNNQNTTNQPEADTRLPSAYRNIPITQSLNLFDTYLNSILISEVGVFKTAAQAIGRGIQQAGKAITKNQRVAQASPQVQQRYQQYKQKLKQDQANYDAFLNGKQIQYKIVDPNTNQEGKDIGTAGPYTVGVISKIETSEAKNLINALKKIAQYTRKGVGAGERLKYAGQAMSALAGIGGAKLYG